MHNTLLPRRWTRGRSGSARSWGRRGRRPSEPSSQTRSKPRDESRDSPSCAFRCLCDDGFLVQKSTSSEGSQLISGGYKSEPSSQTRSRPRGESRDSPSCAFRGLCTNGFLVHKSLVQRVTFDYWCDRRALKKRHLMTTSDHWSAGERLSTSTIHSVTALVA